MREIQPIAGACVWHGSEMAHSTRWLRRLSAAQLAEIDTAIEGARARGLSGPRAAQRGGDSILRVPPAVHNAMLARRPDLAAALYDDVWRSRFGEEDATDRSSYPLPVWGVRDGKFTSHYSRTFVEVAQRRPAAEVPRLSAAQTRALDMLHDLAEELCLAMTFAPGDIQFVNNHVIYHARTEFEDDPAQGADRLLLRLWLAVPNSRALPPGHEVLWP